MWMDSWDFDRNKFVFKMKGKVKVTIDMWCNGEDKIGDPVYIYFPPSQGSLGLQLILPATFDLDIETDTNISLALFGITFSFLAICMNLNYLV